MDLAEAIRAKVQREKAPGRVARTTVRLRDDTKRQLEAAAEAQDLDHTVLAALMIEAGVEALAAGGKRRRRQHP